MPIDALSVLCAQLTRDLLAIAKFLFLPLSHGTNRSKRKALIGILVVDNLEWPVTFYVQYLYTVFTKLSKKFVVHHWRLIPCYSRIRSQIYTNRYENSGYVLRSKPFRDWPTELLADMFTRRPPEAIWRTAISSAWAVNAVQSPVMRPPCSGLRLANSRFFSLPQQKTRSLAIATSWASPAPTQHSQNRPMKCAQN